MTAILVVDDESEIRQVVSTYLARHSYKCIEAANGLEGLQALHANDDCNIVLTDLSMPVMTGLEMIEKAKHEVQRDIQYIVFTGNGHKEHAVSALRLGVVEFLDKPMSWKSLLSSVERAHIESTRLKRQVEASRLAESLRQQLTQTQSKLHVSRRMAAQQLAAIARYKDVETVEHCERVGRYSRLIAELLGFSPELCTDIELAAILHDIGKIGIPDSILMKDGALSECEFKIMTNHTLLGAQMLVDQRDNPILEIAYQIALSHHERWDGSGYPHGLAGTSIPMPARICSIADVYDALRSKRRYKAAFSHNDTVHIMCNGDGRTSPGHFDPELLALFIHNQRQFDEIYGELPDTLPKADDTLEAP
ncbi:MAG: response regulator [Rhodospirillales bacterium]